MTDPSQPQPVTIHTEQPDLKLDFGCGKTPKEGFLGVDFYEPTAKYCVDLFSFPLPWTDNSVTEIHASHFLEHIPAREVEERDMRSRSSNPAPIGKDFLCAFMDECYRILKPGGAMTVIVPSGRSDRAFQDPTHRRFFVESSFAYFSKAWRDANGLGHYLCSCDFGTEVFPSIPNELSVLHPEAQARRFREGWNTTVDLHARMVSLKPTP